MEESIRKALLEIKQTNLPVKNKRLLLLAC